MLILFVVWQLVTDMCLVPSAEAETPKFDDANDDEVAIEAEEIGAVEEED